MPPALQPLHQPAPPLALLCAVPPADVQLERLPGRRERRHHLQTQHGFACECEMCNGDSEDDEEEVQEEEEVQQEEQQQQQES